MVGALREAAASGERRVSTGHGRSAGEYWQMKRVGAEVGRALLRFMSSWLEVKENRANEGD